MTGLTKRFVRYCCVRWKLKFQILEFKTKLTKKREKRSPEKRSLQIKTFEKSRNAKSFIPSAKEKFFWSQIFSDAFEVSSNATLGDMG